MDILVKIKDGMDEPSLNVVFLGPGLNAYLWMNEWIGMCDL